MPLRCLLPLLLVAAVQAMAATRPITDMQGQTHQVPMVVERIASGGAINQMIAMLGGIDRIVATASAVQVNPLFARLYPQIRQVPALYGQVELSGSVEGLVKAHPQVLFGRHPKMASLGYPVLALELRTPAEIKQAVRLVGQVLGPEGERRADRFCHYYDDTLARIRQRTDPLTDDQRPKVYYGGRYGLTTDGDETIADAWIQAGGGRNVASLAGLHGTGNQVSLEQLVAWDPDVIILTDAAATRDLLRQPRWRRLKAVRQGHLYLNPKGVYLWSVRSGEGVLQFLWAAHVIQPDLFADWDLAAQVKDFYQQFYGYRLSDGELNAILTGAPLPPV